MKYCDVKKLSANSRAEKWWEGLDKKEGSKWKTMQHNGVYFPPEYEPLPSKVQILYKGNPVKLDSVSTKNSFGITAEEAAVFFAMKMEQDDRLAEKDLERKKSIDDKKFTDNFWKDWKKILGTGHIISSFKDVDFKPLQKYLSQRSEQKKVLKKIYTVMLL